MPRTGAGLAWGPLVTDRTQLAIISVVRADRERPREQDLPGADDHYQLAITPAPAD